MSGTVRKSKREKEKEAAEVKRRFVSVSLLAVSHPRFFGREEEHEAARAYAEFVDAFEADGASRSKKGNFVKAGGQGDDDVYAPAHREPRNQDGHAKSVSYLVIKNQFHWPHGMFTVY